MGGMSELLPHPSRVALFLFGSGVGEEAAREKGLKRGVGNLLTCLEAPVSFSN